MIPPFGQKPSLRETVISTIFGIVLLGGIISLLFWLIVNHSDWISLSWGLGYLLVNIIFGLGILTAISAGIFEGYRHIANKYMEKEGFKYSLAVFFIPFIVGIAFLLLILYAKAK